MWEHNRQTVDPLLNNFIIQNNSSLLHKRKLAFPSSSSYVDCMRWTNIVYGQLWRNEVRKVRVRHATGNLTEYRVNYFFQNYSNVHSIIYSSKIV